MTAEKVIRADSFLRRFLWVVILGAAAVLVHWLKVWDAPDISLSGQHSLLDFAGLVLILLACRHAVSAFVILGVRHRSGPEGEIRMLNGFLGVITGLVIIGAFVYSLGRLQAVGTLAAGFAGMLLGWSLQAPVSGVAAWVLITLKRPFRIGDRVLFPSLNLLGDIKNVGLMYTVMDQVGGSVGSEEAIGRDILIPNAMLFTQVAINYTPKAQAAFFLDEVVIRITYDSDWDSAEKIMLKAAETVTADIIRETGEKPYIRSDMWDYGILMRLRYMTMAKDRPRITHEIVRHIFKAVQKNHKVDLAIPFVYSFRKSTDGVLRNNMPAPDPQIVEIPVAKIDDTGLNVLGTSGNEAEEQELVGSIRERGLLQPIVVSPSPGAPGRYQVMAGHKRFLAVRKLGWKSVPAVVQSDTRLEP